jgi:DeoR family transcriptional regulator of aga operon
VSRYERWNAILEMLARDEQVDVARAAEAFQVSAATVRRDLDQLAQQQLLTRTRGGAVGRNVSYDLPLRYKTARQADQKVRIAQAAAALVTPGAVVGLNGGTTTTEVGRALATAADLRPDGRDGSLTVVTNAVNIANELTVRSHVKLVVTGGVARPQSYELIGPLAAKLIDEITLDIAILGVNGIHPARGATAHHEGEAAINAHMARRARQVVVVADSSKLSVIAFARICGLEDVDVLVTDEAAEDHQVAQIERSGVQVLRA